MSSAPWARMRATTASMPSTANMTRRMPSVFTGASTGPNRIALGVWNLSSSMPCPSGVRIIARVARTSSSPISFPTKGPSTVVSPSSSRPSSMKNALTASRSSTTMRTLSIRLSVISFLPSLHCWCPYLPHVVYKRTRVRGAGPARKPVVCESMGGPASPAADRQAASGVSAVGARCRRLLKGSGPPGPEPGAECGARGRYHHGSRRGSCMNRRAAGGWVRRRTGLRTPARTAGPTRQDPVWRLESRSTTDRGTSSRGCASEGSDNASGDCSWPRPRSGRGTLRLLRDPELKFEGGEGILGIFAGHLVHPLQAALNAHDRRRIGRQIEEPLLRFRVLHHDLGLPVYGQNLGTAGLLQMLHVRPCVPLEVGKRVDVLQVDHVISRCS